MKKIKQILLKDIESLVFYLVVAFILVVSILKHDYWVAIVDSVCGIAYSFYAGKGKPFCYLFGITASCCYSYLSFKNALWGNLVLYACYYVPMQIMGFFQWNKNLKEGKKEIIKKQLPKSDLFKLCIVSILFILITSIVLNHFNDTHPFLDSITTILSICGMYLTVKRVIEQWVFWIFVNAITLIIWLNVTLSGINVLSQIFKWSFYLILAIYFYIKWRKELACGKNV